MNPFAQPIWRKIVCPFLLGAIFAALFISPSHAASPQSASPREKLHDVLSRQPLVPPLRQRVFVRFSPDGKFLLLQDTTGIFVISRDPFRTIGHIDAQNIYGAIFSSDSKFIRVVGPGLIVSSWSLPGFQNAPNLQLPVKDGCLDARVSSNSETLACYRAGNSMQIYGLVSGAELYSDAAHTDPPRGPGVFLPLDRDIPYAGPMGFLMADSISVLADRHILRVPMFFSPDGQDLLVSSHSGSPFRIDITANRKSAVHGQLSKHDYTFLTRLDANRILVAGPGSKDAPQVFSLDSDTHLASLPISPDSAHLASNSRFLIWQEKASRADHVFDLQENRSVEVPPNLGVDIAGNDLAFFTESGALFLSHLGEATPYRGSIVPLSAFPVVNSASVDPLLKRFAFSTSEGSELVRAEDGKKIASLSKFLSASLDHPEFASIIFPKSGGAPAQIEKLDTADGHSLSVAPIGTNLLRSGGPVLMEYALVNSQGVYRVITNFEGGLHYRLRALDPATGKELWDRVFERYIPIPFPDPQGDRLVLGWKAKDEAAREIANRLPVAKQIFKKAKIKDLDSFFEVLDARTRKSLGGVLVQAGSGPSSFEIAFSIGDSLILVKDDRRVSLYSLQDGTLQARLVGEKPVANAQSNLLALDSGAGRLALYDLRSGAKLDDQLFPGDIAYMQFSADGKRLLVLTAQQLLFVLSTEHPAGGPASRDTATH